MLDKLQKAIVQIGGVKLVNTTPHGVTMVSNDLSIDVSVPVSGVLVNAKAVAKKVDSGIEGVFYQTTQFVPDTATLNSLREFKQQHPDVVVIGSMIAAQAYPGLVVAMVAHPDFMRVAPADKKMLLDTFTVF